MLEKEIDGVILSPLKVIELQEGNVLHGMKNLDSGFAGFGEAYFSYIKSGAIKAWKRHREMTLNIIVPVGKIRFVIFDDRENSTTHGRYQSVVLSKENYCRLTVPPLVWMGFQGQAEETSLLLNLASIPHDPTETDRKDIEDIEYNWSLK